MEQKQGAKQRNNQSHPHVHGRLPMLGVNRPGLGTARNAGRLLTYKDASQESSFEREEGVLDRQAVEDVEPVMQRPAYPVRVKP
jgi:hypothetical protein